MECEPSRRAKFCALLDNVSEAPMQDRCRKKSEEGVPVTENETFLYPTIDILPKNHHGVFEPVSKTPLLAPYPVPEPLRAVLIEIEGLVLHARNDVLLRPFVNVIFSTLPHCRP